MKSYSPLSLWRVSAIVVSDGGSAGAALVSGDKWTSLLLRKMLHAITLFVSMTAEIGLPLTKVEKRRFAAVFWSMLLIIALTAQASVLAAQEPPVSDDPTAVTIYFVGHTEMDLSIPSIPLTTMGVERAAKLVPLFDQVRLTHVFTSHTARSQQTVAAVAEAHDLELIALPALGTRIGSDTVTGRSPSRIAIEPLVGALRSLPSGSTALVAGNSGNLFAIMHGLGVAVVSREQVCAPGDACVPCLDNTCFPEDFDNLWVLTLSERNGSVRLQWLKY